MHFKRILFLFLTFSFSLTRTMQVAAGDFIKGFPTPPRTLSSMVVPTVQALSKNTKIHDVYNEDEIKKHADVTFYTLENMRGKKGQPAYSNQDRASSCALAGKTCWGIFDGHGKKTGGIVSEYVRDNLPKKVLGYKSPRVGFWNGALWMQDLLKKEQNNEAQYGGTTAIMGVLNGDELTVANIGDSRAIGLLGGKLTQLSVDHKPSNESELKRIQKAGGIVYNGYVYGKKGGGLALTRSLGDLAAHEGSVISALPEITSYSVMTGDVLIFASDGLWDVMSNKEVIELAKKPTDAARQLACEARKRGSKDDISVLVVTIK